MNIKKVLFVLFILLVSVKVFCQDSTKVKKPCDKCWHPKQDTAKYDTVYIVSLSALELDQLVGILRTSGKYSSFEIEMLIQGLYQRTRIVTTKSQTTSPK